MRKSILYLSALLMLTAPVQIAAQIFEALSFSEVPSYITPDTLVILDIDDTLLVPVQMCGCDEWFTRRVKKHQAAGMSSMDALEKAIAEWEAVRHLTKMQIVEPGSAEIVHDLQKEGVTVMGLTTQALSLSTRTKLQLKENGIDLNKTPPSKDDIYFCLNGHGILYRHGILFTAGTAKGEVLFTMLDKIGYTPKRILFVNDKATHLTDIEKVAEKRGVEFVGLRYGYSDSRKAGFNWHLAEFQYNNSTLSTLLSDDSALELFQAMSEG